MTTSTIKNKVCPFNTVNVFGDEERTLLSNAITTTWELEFSEETKALYNMLNDLHFGKYNTALPALCIKHIEDKEQLTDLVYFFEAVKQQVDLARIEKLVKAKRISPAML